MKVQGKDTRSHPYAPFLYERYFCPGVTNKEILVGFSGQQERNSFVRAFETQFKTVRRELTRPRSRRSMIRCNKITQEWLKQLRFETGNPVLHEDRRGKIVSIPLSKNQLVQAIAFVQTALHVVDAAFTLSVEEKLLKAIKKAQKRQKQAIGAYYAKYVQRDNPERVVIRNKKPAPAFVLARQ